MIRWGMIGCGDVCEVKSGPGFQKAAGSALVAVARRDAQAAADFARRHAVPRWHADAAALIADAEVDAVYVATPPGSHLELAQQIANAGKPCLVEKPMARSAEECEAMIAAFERAGVPLFVAYYRRCLPRFQKVTELLAGVGVLREIRYALRKRPAAADAGERPWRLRAEQSGGGLFLDVGCHALDLIDHLCGPLTQVTGFAENRGGRYPEEDHVELRWAHAGGAQGLAVFEFDAAAEADELRIVGTAGLIVVPVFEEGAVRLETSAGVESVAVPHPAHVHQPLIQSVVDTLRGGGTCPATAVAAMRTSRAIDQVLTSYYGTRTGEFWASSAAWPGAGGESRG